MLECIFHENFQIDAGSNAEKTAINNRRLVLKTLMNKNSMSRSELAKICHLRKQTLTNIIKELTDLNLIREGGRKIDGKGQPKKLLEINPTAVLAIGVHIDQGYIKALSMDWEGNIRLQSQERLSDKTPKNVVKYIEGIVKNIIAQEKKHCEIISGIGISLPNLLDNNLKSYQGSSGWEEWVDFPIKDILEKKFNLPIYIENDATACAFGHLNTEKFKDLSHFVTIFIGHGLGGGIISNKISMKGFWGNAGEIGQIRTPSKQLIEHTLSLNGFKKALNIYSDDIPSQSEFMKRLKNKDDTFYQWLENAAADLRYLTNILENIFDPETIIVSGYLPQEITEMLIQRAYPLHDSISNRQVRNFERISLGYCQKGITAKGAALSTLLL